ncbi:hypothetical protein D3C85_1421280 [compost metagenome]
MFRCGDDRVGCFGNSFLLLWCLATCNFCVYHRCRATSFLLFQCFWNGTAQAAHIYGRYRQYDAGVFHCFSGGQFRYEQSFYQTFFGRSHCGRFFDLDRAGTGCGSGDVCTLAYR